VCSSDLAAAAAAAPAFDAFDAFDAAGAMADEEWEHARLWRRHTHARPRAHPL
jgi:hypothetical protein